LSRWIVFKELIVIKVLNIKVIDSFGLELTFSNGDTAHFDGAEYLASRSGSLLDLLRNPAYFARCFVDVGAVCWPNGLELSGTRVHELSRVLA
jgi:Protein of unknown function (DUF2442)